MTALEYTIARHVHVLEQKKRSLTIEERDFLKRVASLLRRLAEEEAKSISRSRA